MELSRKCTEYGGYTVSPTGQIKGLIYAPFVRFIREKYSVDAEVVTGITADGVGRCSKKPNLSLLPFTTRFDGQTGSRRAKGDTSS
jgi:hypothetical protein